MGEQEARSREAWAAMISEESIKRHSEKLRQQEREEIEAQLAPLRTRIAELEAQLAAANKAIEGIAPWLSASLDGPVCPKYEAACNAVFDVDSRHNGLTFEQLKELVEKGDTSKWDDLPEEPGLLGDAITPEILQETIRLCHVELGGSFQKALDYINAKLREVG